MKKYKNEGKNFGIVLDGKTYDFENGEVSEAPVDLKERLKGINEKLIEVGGSKNVEDSFRKNPPKPTIIGEFPLPLIAEDVIPIGFKKCENCGTIWKPKSKTSKFCKRSCYNEWRRKN